MLEKTLKLAGTALRILDQIKEGRLAGVKWRFYFENFCGMVID